MKFKMIKRLISNPMDCSHIALYGEIEEEETLEDADFILRNRLASMMNDDNERRRLCSETESLHRLKAELEGDCEKLREHINKNKKVLESNGIDVDDLLDFIPF